MSAPPDARLFTVGHSNHPFDRLITLLRDHGVTAVADVRSSPFSRFCPQHNRDALTAGLRAAGLRYAFLGRELGARREEPECYEGGRVRFERVARSPLFRRGLDRVRAGAASYRVALLCAEKDPLDCHRAVLVCRHLRGLGPIYHILGDGRLEAHADAEFRMLAACRLPAADLFRSRPELIEEAYRARGERVAYRRPPVSPASSDG